MTTVTGATSETYNSWNAATGLLDYSVTAGTDTTRYTYDAYLQRTREACAALSSVEARPVVEGRVA